MGLTGRDDSCCAYDPYYCPRYSPWNYDFDMSGPSRQRYLEELKKKVREGYRNPDILFATKEPSFFPTGECQVLMLADENRYEFPPYADESSQNAAEYFKRFFYEDERHRAEEGLVFNSCRLLNSQRRIRTLSECGRYEDYFVVEIPGRISCADVSLGNEAISRFVEAFKKTYRKRSESDNRSGDVRQK